MTQLSVTQVCAPTPNPRTPCAKCYRPEQCEKAGGPRDLNPPRPGSQPGVLPLHQGHGSDSTRPRDVDLERYFMDIAARAAGHHTPDGKGDDHGLSDYADGRALPGGVRANMDHRREACEEAADLRNYLVWRAESVYDEAMAGDALALDRYEWALRCLSKLVPLWRELLRDAS